MLIEYSRLKDLPIFELETKSKVGVIKDFFIDHEEKAVEAVIASTGGIFKREKYISAKEILELTKDALVVESSESIIDPKEMVRLHKKEKSRAKIIGEKVVTKKGDFLGTVYDYVLENSTFSITRIYIKKMLDQRIIHSSAIVKIEQHKIIVKDNFEMVRPTPIPGNAKLA